MWLLDYVRQYTTLRLNHAPEWDGVWIHHWRECPFGSFVITVIAGVDPDCTIVRY